MSTGRLGAGDTAIQPTLLDAKGDLVTATAADTPARLAVGNNGETLVADSGTATGLRWQGDYNTGKNKVINGDFGIWQRGSSFNLIGGETWTSDRWYGYLNAATVTVSRQSFTVGAAPVSGYESEYFLRFAQTGSGTSLNAFGTKIEDVRTLAGQKVTLSYWMKTSASISLTPYVFQRFGSGGSSQVYVSGTTITPTSSWVRYSTTIDVPSISGKTLGTGNHIVIEWQFTTGTTANIDIWGVQLEAGSVATPFTTATGTLQGELAACQRYYQVIGGVAVSYPLMGGYSVSGSEIRFPTPFPVQMRTAPTITKNGTWEAVNCGQPSAVYISSQGFCYQTVTTGTGTFYIHPNSSDDSFTISAEL